MLVVLLEKKLLLTVAPLDVDIDAHFDPSKKFGLFVHGHFGFSPAFSKFPHRHSILAAQSIQPSQSQF